MSILHHILPLPLMVSLFLLAGCAASRPTPPAAVAEVQFDKQQVWQLVSVKGKEVSRTHHLIVVSFNPDASLLNGRGPCNEFSATFVLPSPSGHHEAAEPLPFRVEKMVSSDIQCPEGGSNAEVRHLALLSKADAYRLTPLTLTLYQKGKETLKYELQ